MLQITKKKTRRNRGTYLHKKGRKCPKQPAKLFKVGTRKKGNDGKMWKIHKSKGNIHRWIKIKGGGKGKKNYRSKGKSFYSKGNRKVIAGKNKKRTKSNNSSDIFVGPYASKFLLGKSTIYKGHSKKKKDNIKKEKELKKTLKDHLEVQEKLKRSPYPRIDIDRMRTKDGKFNEYFPFGD